MGFLKSASGSGCDYVSSGHNNFVVAILTLVI